MPPTFAMPEVVPSAVSGAQAALDRAPPLDPGLFEPEALPADAPARPVSPVSRLMRRTAPPVVSSRPEVASERPARPESAAAEPVPESVVIGTETLVTAEASVAPAPEADLSAIIANDPNQITAPPAKPKRGWWRL